MLLPGIIHTILFKYLPIYGIVMAFQRFNPALGYFRSEWVGFYYFKRFFADYFAWRITRNTLVLNVYNLALGFPAPLILALLLNEVRWSGFKRTVQTITYFPYFVSVVIVVGIMKEVLSINGLVNVMIERIGLEQVSFFTDPRWFRMMYVWSGIWQGAGWTAILYLAAIAGIDPDLYLAAVVDGAGRLRRIFHITVPGMMPTAIIILIVSLGGMFGSDFQKILLMYNASIYETSDVIATYIFREGLEGANYAYSAAIGLMLSVMSFLFVWLANNISRRVTQRSLW